jgi:DNA-binding LacI/PurR family transcriptional regulator
VTPARSDSRDRPTLETIARHLGVSRATVSNAYNRPDQLSSALRDRVLAAAAELGYPGPDPAARGLRRGRAGAVGVLICDRLSYAFTDPAAVVTLDGLASALEGEGAGLLLLPGVEGGGSPPDLVRNAVVDGFITYGLAADDPGLEAARARSLPLVLVDHPARRGEVAVTVDDAGGAAAVAEHLLALGHRHIAAVSFELGLDRRSGPADPARVAASTFVAPRERLVALAGALDRAGTGAASLPVWECVHNGRHDGREAATALLAGEPRPTAIVALSDELALGVLDAAADAGLDVPGDLSVTGFDDTPAAALGRPPLTTIRQPLHRKGEVAGRTLVELVAGRRPSRVRRLPTELVVRGTTGPPR